MLHLPQSGYNKIEYTSGGISSCELNSRCRTLMEKVVGQAQECVAMVFQITLSVYLEPAPTTERSQVNRKD